MSQQSYKDPLGREVYLIKKNNELSEIITSLFKESYKIERDSFKIGILGDLHGHISQALKQLESWELFSNHKLDVILQVGDLGVYNEHTTIDKTTLEISEKDPAELDFKKYYNRSDEGDYFFDENGVFSNTPFFFALGNHDDSKVMQYSNNPCFYKNIQFIPNGETVKLTKNEKSLTIGSLGHNYAAGDVKRLSKEKLDILLTHQPPKSEMNLEGDEKTGNFVKNLSPNYTFFGHIHEGAFQKTFQYLNLYGLNQVSNRAHKSKGALGALYLSSEEKSQFIYLPDSI